MNQITTDVQIEPQYYEDGTVVISIDRVKGNSNRITTVNLYEYDDIVGIVTASSRGTMAIKPIEQNSGYVYNLNMPNICKGSIKMRYTLPEKSETTLRMYDISGREVVNMKIESTVGNNEFTTGKNLSSGVYFYQFESEYGTERGKITYLK